MQYSISPEVISSIGQLKNILIKNFFVSVFIVIGGCFLLYIYSGKTLDFSYFTGVIITIILVGLMDRWRTVKAGSEINRTATEITILEDKIVIKTPSFKVLPWFNKPSSELEFKLNYFRIKVCNYPVKAVYDLDKKVYKIETNQQEIYIITDYFDKELVQKLDEF